MIDTLTMDTMTFKQWMAEQEAGAIDPDQAEDELQQTATTSMKSGQSASAAVNQKAADLAGKAKDPSLIGKLAAASDAAAGKKKPMMKKK